MGKLFKEFEVDIIVFIYFFVLLARHIASVFKKTDKDMILA